MRVHYRTSRNTGVSLGCFGTLFVLAILVGFIALPVYFLGALLGVERSTAWGFVMLAWVVLVLVAYGRKDR